MNNSDATRIEREKNAYSFSKGLVFGIHYSYLLRPDIPVFLFFLLDVIDFFFILPLLEISLMF